MCNCHDHYILIWSESVNYAVPLTNNFSQVNRGAHRVGAAALFGQALVPMAGYRDGREDADCTMGGAAIV